MIRLGVSIPLVMLELLCSLHTFTVIVVWDINSSVLDSDDKFPSSRPLKQIPHNCQTVRILERKPL